jgi:hypothetical protein
MNFPDATQLKREASKLSLSQFELSIHLHPHPGETLAARMASDGNEQAQSGKMQAPNGKILEWS